MLCIFRQTLSGNRDVASGKSDFATCATGPVEPPWLWPPSKLSRTAATTNCQLTDMMTALTSGQADLVAAFAAPTLPCPHPAPTVCVASDAAEKAILPASAVSRCPMPRVFRLETHGQ
eukprot:gene6579-biopygen5358